MAEFSLHPRFSAEEITPEAATARLEAYEDEYDAVSLGDDETESPSDPDVFAPDHSLEIDDVDAYAEIYLDLRDSPAVADVRLWGPPAQRYPVRVEHYALQKISTPDSFEFYALDEQVTLVIGDTRQAVEQLRREIPPPALG